MRIGDTVQLKTGGQIMKVAELALHSIGPSARCIWSYNGRPHSMWSPESNLNIIATAQPEEPDSPEQQED